MASVWTTESIHSTPKKNNNLKKRVEVKVRKFSNLSIDKIIPSREEKNGSSFHKGQQRFAGRREKSLMAKKLRSKDTFFCEMDIKI